MKGHFTLPQKPTFAKGEKKLFAMRIHKNLLEEIKKIAESRGFTATDLIIHALDEYAQWAKAQKAK